MRDKFSREGRAAPSPRQSTAAPGLLLRKGIRTGREGRRPRHGARRSDSGPRLRGRGLHLQARRGPRRQIFASSRARTREHAFARQNLRHRVHEGAARLPRRGNRARRARRRSGRVAGRATRRSRSNDADLPGAPRDVFFGSGSRRLSRACPSKDDMTGPNGLASPTPTFTQHPVDLPLAAGTPAGSTPTPTAVFTGTPPTATPTPAIGATHATFTPTAEPPTPTVTPVLPSPTATPFAGTPTPTPFAGVPTPTPEPPTPTPGEGTPTPTPFGGVPTPRRPDSHDAPEAQGAPGRAHAAAISATIARAAAAGSGAPVIGRPTTRRSAPARIASPGVATRLWSPAASPRGRTPGTTRRKSPPAFRADRLDLLGRAHDAVEARVLREDREAQRGLARRAFEADGADRCRVEGRQDRHGDELRRRKARLSRRRRGPLRRTPSSSPCRPRHGSSRSRHRCAPPRPRPGPPCSECRGA